MVQAKLDTAPQKGQPKRRPHQQLPAKKPAKKTQLPTKAQNAKDQETTQPVTREDIHHHQRLLDVFRRTFNEVITDADFEARQQTLKTALFERDFVKAFQDPSSLPVYAARWSPTRALCYASVLKGIRPHLDRIITTPEEERQNLKVLSIGGCAAELAAFCSLLSYLPPSVSGHLSLLDSGPWGEVIASMTQTFTTPPPISKYASEAAKLAAEKAIVDPAARLSVQFLQEDIISLATTSPEKLVPILGAQTEKPLLVTIMFTLNELFTASGIGKTTLFLQNLTASIPFGSLLLVVDSAGSYSEATVGKEQKKYPMQWLLDHIVLGTQKTPVENRTWKKIESHDSVWFRHTEYLDYPIPLENMRYQMHLYKVVDSRVPEENEHSEDSD
ncbi:hypothetical protein QBC35DRAFT_159639 [Podospora australis]|uniref:25S rRNA (Uridine(2843)-N(3))-methyltransferase n=1 Tax=Podospora australis TaxID=1536484 RepID=A0AAN6X313_9PEZI|nr:hypothetical protein QBC35DRAFT_159639 [Podospora australis]